MFPKENSKDLERNSSSLDPEKPSLNGEHETDQDYEVELESRMTVNVRERNVSDSDEVQVIHMAELVTFHMHGRCQMLP